MVKVEIFIVILMCMLIASTVSRPCRGGHHGNGGGGNSGGGDSGNSGGGDSGNSGSGDSGSDGSGDSGNSDGDATQDPTAAADANVGTRIKIPLLDGISDIISKLKKRAVPDGWTGGNGNEESGGWTGGNESGGWTDGNGSESGGWTDGNGSETGGWTDGNGSVTGGWPSENGSEEPSEDGNTATPSGPNSGNNENTMYDFGFQP